MSRNQGLAKMLARTARIAFLIASLAALGFYVARVMPPGSRDGRGAQVKMRGTVTTQALGVAAVDPRDAGASSSGTVSLLTIGDEGRGAGQPGERLPRELNVPQIPEPPQAPAAPDSAKSASPPQPLQAATPPPMPPGAASTLPPASAPAESAKGGPSGSMAGADAAGSSNGGPSGSMAGADAAGSSNGDGSGPNGADALLVPPVLLKAAWLEYPDAALKKRKEGRVEVRILVGVDGSVTSVELAESQVDTMLARAATQSARSMKFRPATRGGRPVPVWYNYRFDFSLPRSG